MVAVEALARIGGRRLRLGGDRAGAAVGSEQVVSREGFYGLVANVKNLVCIGTASFLAVKGLRAYRGISVPKRGRRRSRVRPVRTRHRVREDDFRPTAELCLRGMARILERRWPPAGRGMWSSFVVLTARGLASSAGQVFS